MSRLRRIGVAIKSEDYARRMMLVQDGLAGGTEILDGQPRQASPFRTLAGDVAGAPPESDLEEDVVR